MTQKKKWWWIAGTIAVLLAVATLVVIRYVPWHKLVKVPTASEKAFLHKDILNARAPNTLSFDFEVDSTLDIPSGIYEGIAHSGNYSAKSFGKNAFSVSVVRTAGEIGLDHLAGVGLSAWVYVFPSDNEVNGSLVFSATNSVGVNICWKGVHLSGPLIPQEQWTKISGYFNLSDVRLRSDDKIQLYFWNNSDTKILVDDFYFVFGAPKERMGSSSLTDLTDGKTYQPKFNFPPFRTQLLQPATNQIKSNDGNSLSTGIFPSLIQSGDRILSGHFITPGGTRESILVIKPGTNPELYHFCPEKDKFVSVPLSLPEETPSLDQEFSLLTGSFLGNGYDQLFIAGPAGQALISFTPDAGVCSGSQPGPVKGNILWKSTEAALADIPLDASNKCLAARLVAGQPSGLILFDRNGSWKILRFTLSSPEKGSWQTEATGTEYPVREWDRSLNEFSVWAAPFRSGSSGDLLLTVVKDLKTGAFRYTLLQYDPADRKFLRLYSDKQGSSGLTIGLDTLKTTDLLYPGHFRSGDALTVIRYNRDWRFDLKQIQFTDTAFTICNVLDFDTEDPDANPKFCEEVEIATGNWFDPAITSVMVVGRNRSLKPDPALPEVPGSAVSAPGPVQFFSMPSKKPQP